MKTAHRNQAHAKRQIRYPHLPKFFQPKQPPTLQLTCKVIHHDMIETVRTGKAGLDDLWDFVRNAFTYAEMMRLLIEDGSEFTAEAIAVIKEQAEMTEALVDRYVRTGRFGFNGEQLMIATAAAFLMDDLIAMDRNGIAGAAKLASDHATNNVIMAAARRMLANGQRVAA